jgi:hypothetical protein
MTPPGKRRPGSNRGPCLRLAMVAHRSINRPEARNAVNGEFARGVAAAIDELAGTCPGFPLWAICARPVTAWANTEESRTIGL